MNDLQTAMHNANDIDQQMSNAVSSALTTATPVFSTHSTSLAQRLAAEGQAIVAQLDEIDKKIALLQAEREDYMLAHSMLSHAMTARETGSKQG